MGASAMYLDSRRVAGARMLAARSVLACSVMRLYFRCRAGPRSASKTYCGYLPSRIGGVSTHDNRITRRRRPVYVDRSGSAGLPWPSHLLVRHADTYPRVPRSPEFPSR